MMNQKMVDALNDQINAEFHSGYLYLSMSAYFQEVGLAGVANWMRVQSQEEYSHANKMFDYICERGGRVLLRPIAEVDVEFGTTLEAFKQVLEHEEMVTTRINYLMDVAIEVNDHATKSFLQWFVDEQVEEEATVSDIINNVKLINGEGQGMLMLDREFGSRVFVDATKE